MTTASSIGFLDLPAEIRNEIYALLIDDVDTNVGPRTIRLRPRSEFSKYWKRKNPHRGEVYALNQVCRTTRREFGPLYVSHVAHRIRVDEQTLPQFLQDFFLDQDSENSFALRPKKIEFELPYPLGGKPQRLNFMSLLTLCLGNSDLQCTFLNKFGPMPELDNMFWGHAVAWGDAILDDLLDILVYTSHGTTTTVDLVFRDDAKLQFIDEVPRGKRGRVLPSMRGYLTELGAVNGGTWDTRVGVWNTQARVEFSLSKRSAGNRLKTMIASKAFETQYRLVEA